MHLTTLSPAAFVGDVALLWLLWMGVSEWPVEQATLALQALLGWMVFSKCIKLVTHFARYPVDILLWPVSIIFGWFHGIIKFYAFATLNEVSHASDRQLREVPLYLCLRHASFLIQIATLVNRFWWQCEIDGQALALSPTLFKTLPFVKNPPLTRFTLQTTWGSRAGADASDSERMRKITEAKSNAICEKSSISDNMKSQFSCELKHNLSLRS